MMNHHFRKFSFESSWLINQKSLTKFEPSLRAMVCPPGNLGASRVEKIAVNCHLLVPIVFELEENHTLWQKFRKEIVQNIFA
jgi:hypothetical protein